MTKGTADVVTNSDVGVAIMVLEARVVKEGCDSNIVVLARAPASLKGDRLNAVIGLGWSNFESNV